MRWFTKFIPDAVLQHFPGITDQEKPAPSPFDVTLGVISTLEKRATDRRDMRAVGQLVAARNLINREALRGVR